MGGIRRSKASSPWGAGASSRSPQRAECGSSLPHPRGGQPALVDNLLATGGPRHRVPACRLPACFLRPAIPLLFPRRRIPMSRPPLLKLAILALGFALAMAVLASPARGQFPVFYGGQVLT